MRPNIAFHRRLEEFVRGRKFKYTDIAKQIRLATGNDITHVAIADYCNISKIMQRSYVEDKRIESVKNWMQGALLQEEAEASKGRGTLLLRAKLVHAVIGSAMFTEGEKKEIANFYCSK